MDSKGKPPKYEHVSVVGLVGGVASGKSAVARRFAELGAVIIDGDELGHLVLSEPDVIGLLRQRWGDAVVDQDGQIIRREVAGRVFADADELRYLESVTHPRIGRRIADRIALMQADRGRVGRHQMFILDAAVMFKAGWDTFCDSIVFVDASLETRKNRAIQRGWSVEQFESRESSQLPTEEKRRRSDIVIDNNGCLEQTYEQVLKAMKSLSH